MAGSVASIRCGTIHKLHGITTNCRNIIYTNVNLVFENELRMMLASQKAMKILAPRCVLPLKVTTLATVISA